MDETWEIIQDHLHFLGYGFRFQIHCFVLMANHYHMIVRTPESNLAEGMRWFAGQTAKEINHRSGKINQLWGGRYFRSLIKSDHHYLNVYKYVYCNPVRAGIVKNVLDYKYSTLRGLLGFEHLVIPAIDDTLFSMGVEKCIQWLNQTPEEKNIDAVRKGLRRSVFQLACNSNDSKPNHLDSILL
jgi:putative transposase